MPEMISPHGGLTEPIDRQVPASEQADFQANLKDAKRAPISDADLSTLYRIGDGGLSPLTGPMDQETWNRVLDESIINSNGKAYAWTIPLAFPVSSDQAGNLKSGDTVALVNSKDEIVGSLAVSDVYEWDKPRYLKGVYGTDRTDHPGGKMVSADDRTHLIGGEVKVLPQPRHPEYGKYVLSPRESRAMFQEKGYDRIVAFQTRNPLHRAHEYALVAGLERLTAEGHFTGAVLNPLIGETKGDDVDAATRMRTYEALIDNKALGQGDSDDELWQKAGCAITDRIHLLGLDIKMFYGGPKEAVMHGIYRQNFGFTDIVIGRKHADAPFEDGSDIWDPLDAQRIFDNLNGELKIQPVKIGFAAFYEELGRVGLVDEYGPKGKGYTMVSISGREVRENLRKGEMPDPRIMRPETAAILIERMKEN